MGKKSTSTNTRSADIGQILMLGSTGFTMRKRTGVGMFVHFFLLGAMVVMGASLLVYFNSPEGCVLAAVIGGCFAMIAQNLEKLKKTKNALEFMGALFSSALGKGYAFTFIVKSTGEIVYHNRPFQSVFPAYVNQSTRTLATLLTLYQVPQEHQEQIKTLLTSKGEGTITTTVKAAADAEGKSFALLIEPIERPTGFVIIRGK